MLRVDRVQIADGLLADADAARDIARQAIAQSEKILRDAQESLKTLQGAHILSMLPIVLMLM